MNTPHFKLVVTDMDGTLLDAEHRLPAEFESVVTALRQKGCRWVIASGRQLANLKARFDALGVPVDVIAENGALALCAEENEPFYKDLTPVAHFRPILERAIALPGVTPVLCGATCAWVHDAYPEHFNEVGRYFEKVNVWHAFAEIAHVEVCKVAIYHPHAATELHPALAPLETLQTRVILSGPNWVDVQSASVDKSHALKALMTRFDCAPEEVIVFGDYFNDVGMLTCGVHGVAMGNALPEIQALTPHHAPKNTENGVIAYLHQIHAL
jgi:Cof subfamily protein (haloacid dehalogenase superfamily)